MAASFAAIIVTHGDTRYYPGFCDMSEELLFLLVGSVLALSLLIALITSRMSVPALVVFLAIGMLLGTDGIGHMDFHNVELARTVGVAGLALILFEGGLSTSWRRLREVAVPALLLSTAGVIITALLVGYAAHYLFDFGWGTSLLLGAVISSTDAAAVFATLRFTNIKRRLARTLEAETGGNDPMAIALTVGLISWIQQPAYNLGDLVLLLVQQLGVGLIVGLMLGGVAMWVFSRLPKSIGAFAPVASLAACALSFGVAGILGGSGFLAVYIVGLAIGSTPSRYRSQLTSFHEGLAFLAQVSLFVVLGLLVMPHELLPIAGASILLTLLLIFFIRPLAVFLVTPHMGFSYRDKTLLGWAGLRGAVPIVLGTIVLSAEVAHGEVIFNIVFFVVLVSALIQGTTLEWVATKLGVIEQTPKDAAGKEVDYDAVLQKVQFDVAPGHSIIGSRVNELGLPAKATLIKVRRGSVTIKPDQHTVIKLKDRLTVSIPQSRIPELEDVFTRWRRRV